MTGDVELDPHYIAARRVLLDALDALVPHRKAVIVVGPKPSTYVPVMAISRSRHTRPTATSLLPRSNLAMIRVSMSR